MAIHIIYMYNVYNQIKKEAGHYGKINAADGVEFMEHIWR